MGKKLRKGLMAAVIAVEIAAGGAFCYTRFLQYKIDSAREKRVSTLVERYKQCPERFARIGGCHSPSERIALMNQARIKQDKKDFQEAGIKFAEAGMENEARMMADECQKAGNKEGRKMILEEIRIRKEAARQFSESR